MASQLQSSWIYGIAIVVMAVGLVLVNLMPESSDKTLVASGSAETKAVPDEAVIFIGVETLSKNANESQQENSRIMNSVMDGLKAVDADKEIKTSSFSVFPEYDYKMEGRQFIGYRTINTIELTTSDIGKVGEFISAASDAGANRVESLQFRLSEAKRAEVSNQVLAMATSNARTKAESIASAAGVKLGRLKSISESSPVVFPVFRDAKAVMEAAAPAPIEPGEVQVSASVTLVYGI